MLDLTALQFAGLCWSQHPVSQVEISDSDFTQRGLVPLVGGQKRRAEFLAGRQCAYDALAQLTGNGVWLPSRQQLGPEWPTGTCGSLSHSCELAVACVGKSSQWQSIGIDVERLQPAERAQRLASQIMTSNELAWFNPLPEEIQPSAFSILFSAKESLFKALHPLVGRRFYFHDVELYVAPQEGRLSLQLLIDLAPKWRKYQVLALRYLIQQDYVLSLLAIAQPRSQT